MIIIISIITMIFTGNAIYSNFAYSKEKQKIRISSLSEASDLSNQSDQPNQSIKQSKNKKFEDTIPQEILNDGEDNYITITEENDFFGLNGTDQNYTNGIMINWFNRDIRKSSIAKSLSHLIPKFEMDGTTSVYYSIGHNIYTPADIEKTIPDPNDRPYAAFLYGSVGFSDIEGDHIDDIEVTIGVVGPSAFGEQIQENFHNLIKTTKPKGWGYQIKDELGLMISWQQRWPEFFTKNIGKNSFFRFMPHIGAALGNIYTFINAGFNIQLLPKSDRWQSQPLRVRPSIPGSGFFSNFKKNWSMILFIGNEVRIVGRNIFLDGNTFKDSPSIEKEYFVIDFNIGVALSYKNMRISYTINQRTKEFKNQDKDQNFGSLSLGIKF